MKRLQVRLHPYDAAGFSIREVNINGEPRQGARGRVPGRDKLHNYNLAVGKYRWLVLDPYGDDILPQVVLDAVFGEDAHKHGHTIAVERRTGRIYLVRYYLGGTKLVDLCLESADRRVPERHLPRIDDLRGQKRPFCTTFHDWDLMKFIEREVGYDYLRKEVVYQLRLGDTNIDLCADGWREVSAWHSTNEPPED